MNIRAPLTPSKRSLTELSVRDEKRWAGKIFSLRWELIVGLFKNN